MSNYAEPWHAFVGALEQEIELAAPTHPTGALRTVLRAAKEGLAEAERWDEIEESREYENRMGEDL